MVRCMRFCNWSLVIAVMLLGIHDLAPAAHNVTKRAQSGVTNYRVVVTCRPPYFVPGHSNIVKYRIYPDDYVAEYGKFEIFRRGQDGGPTGSAVYSSTDINKAGGAERTFAYSGTDINYMDARYILKISVGESAATHSFDIRTFDVAAWGLIALFPDEVTDAEKAAIEAGLAQAVPGYDAAFDKYDGGETPECDPMPYCAGIAISTVTSSKVQVKVWYWDQTETDAGSLTIADGLAIASISAADWQNVWGQDAGDKQWYDDRGGALCDLNSVFYTTPSESQYFYVKITVADGGVMDNVGNPFDAKKTDGVRQATVRYKLRLDGDGTLTVLETTYYE